MKLYLKFLFGIFFSVFIISCSPAHVLFVKNNTDKEKEIFVELIENKFPKKILFCKEQVSNENLSHKAFPKYYKEGKCYHETINVIGKRKFIKLIYLQITPLILLRIIQFILIKKSIICLMIKNASSMILNQMIVSKILVGNLN